MSGEEIVEEVLETKSGHDGSAFEFEGKTYHIEPTALSSKVMTALARLYDKRLASQRKELLEALRDCKTEDEKDLVKDMFGYTTDKFAKVQQMFQEEEGVATVLHLCCPQVETFENALRIAQTYPSFIELFKSVAEATSLEAVGN